jgi:hypothetical protein
MTPMLYDRALLLAGPKRDEVLALWEIQRYGIDSYGDPDYVSLYGLGPEDWYARGVRILGRTAVECTRDRLADLIGRDVAEVVSAASGTSASVVVDPFAGSGNTLYWIQRHVEGRRALGFELDDAVFESSVANLAILGADIELLHVDWKTGFRSLAVREDDLLIVFVAPPWGDALSASAGLDLRRTSPPVAAIVDMIALTFPRRRLLVAAQVFEIVEGESLTDLEARFDWSTVKTYGINEPGQQHGVVLGTIGWRPDSVS